MLQQFTGDPSRMGEHLAELGDIGWVVWAPDNPEDLIRIIGGFRNFAAQHYGPFRLHIVIRSEPCPGLQDPALLLDLWCCPLFEPKHQDVVKSVDIYHQPVLCVVSHATGPMQVPQTVAMATLKRLVPLPCLAWLLGWSVAGS